MAWDFKPENCKHEHYMEDAFMRDFRVRRTAPGKHLCAHCGSAAEEIEPGVFKIWFPEGSIAADGRKADLQP